MSTSPAPVVSVAMPIWKPHPVYFRQAVESVLSQTFHNLELVIIEDPSEVSGQELLSDFKDPRIRYFINPHRTSLIQQRNRSIQESRAKLVALLDGDDIAEPDRIAKQVLFLNENPDIGVVGTYINLMNGNGDLQGYRVYPTGKGNLLKSMPYFNPVAQPSAMIRKEPFQQIGGYTYQKYVVCSDYDLWCRLAKAGVAFDTIPEPLTRYRIHGGGLKSTKLYDTIRATIDIKQTHWAEEMDWKARLRMKCEEMLLFLPAYFTLSLFKFTQFRNNKSKPERYGPK